VDLIANVVAASPSRIVRALCRMNWSGVMVPSSRSLQAMAMANAWAAAQKDTEDTVVAVAVAAAVVVDVSVLYKIIIMYLGQKRREQGH